MLFSRVRFWGLVIILLVYIAGVLILSAVSLHESKSAGVKVSFELKNSVDF